MTIFPFVFQLGPVEVTGYGLMMMVAFLMGGWLIALELKRRGLSEDYAADMIAAAVIGGIVGAKLWYVALTQDAGALFSRGGLVWYGGFIGGTAAVILNGWRLKVPLRWTMQLAAPALPAAYALGRIGCFLVNDDYGRPTDLPWAVKAARAPGWCRRGSAPASAASRPRRAERMRSGRSRPTAVRIDGSGNQRS
jgi:phosphatidylglycerol:prolipoprotein diacylglycerol transferase